MWQSSPSCVVPVSPPLQGLKESCFTQGHLVTSNSVFCFFYLLYHKHSSMTLTILQHSNRCITFQQMTVMWLILLIPYYWTSWLLLINSTRNNNIPQCLFAFVGWIFSPVFLLGFPSSSSSWGIPEGCGGLMLRRLLCSEPLLLPKPFAFPKRIPS